MKNNKLFFSLFGMRHILYLTASGKGSGFTVPGIWPLCYTWIGYQQANGPPRVLQSKSVDHGSPCAHSEYTDNSDLVLTTAPLRCCPLFSSYFVTRQKYCSLLLISACLPITSWASGCQGPAAIAVLRTLDRLMPMMYPYAALRLIFPVIIPHIKHASSLAIAATATFFFFPFRISL